MNARRQEQAPPLRDSSPFKEVSLSERERSVLQGLVAGKSNKEISAGLNISSATLTQYIRSLFLKTRVHNRTQLAVMATTARLNKPQEVSSWDPTGSHITKSDRTRSKAD
ncbi:MAG: LuxR family transcriptional regulator [Terriglobia bacterium]